MKRFIISITFLFFCTLVLAQTPIICESGLNRITYSTSAGSYSLVISDEIGGRVDILALNKNDMLGILDIMEGVLSGKYPNLVGLHCGGGFAKLTREEMEGGLLVSYEENYVVIDAATIKKFKEALKGEK